MHSNEPQSCAASRRPCAPTPTQEPPFLTAHFMQLGGAAHHDAAEQAK